MPHTLRTYRTLRTIRPRRMTPAGRFWSIYIVFAMLAVYMLSDWITRAAA